MNQPSEAAPPPPPVNPPGPELSSFISEPDLQDLIRRARIEDMGPSGVDLTSQYLVPAHRPCRAVIRARCPGRLAGMSLLPAIVRSYSSTVMATSVLVDSQAIKAGAVAAELTGSLRDILALERLALNFMSHLSGIATLTNHYVSAVVGTGVQIYDTRKTLPGLRALQKYAVVCGGGHNHRFGLFDAVLVKDNHIADLMTPQTLHDTVRRVIGAVARSHPPPGFIQFEVDGLDQLTSVLEALGPTRTVPIPTLVLLDNMKALSIQQAVRERGRLAPWVQLEASGSIGLDNIRSIAQTGVDRISVGRLTHSAPSLDMGLDLL